MGGILARFRHHEKRCTPGVDPDSFNLIVDSPVYYSFILAAIQRIQFAFEVVRAINLNDYASSVTAAYPFLKEVSAGGRVSPYERVSREMMNGYPRPDQAKDALPVDAFRNVQGAVKHEVVVLDHMQVKQCGTMIPGSTQIL